MEKDEEDDEEKTAVVGPVGGAAVVAGGLRRGRCRSGSQPVSQGAASSEDSDQAAADEVAALIDAIYVQQWTEDTDAQCQAAKAGWDALTDVQKALVQGENASPDYFGLDTGDPNQDNALNQDDIGDREILVVSFGHLL